jgi:HlyD family secretion protein
MAGGLFLAAAPAWLLAADRVAPHEAVPVKAAVAESTTLRHTTRQPATVHAYHSADMYARVTGYVKETPVDIGDRVKAGQPLAVVDVPEMDKQLLVAQAHIARAEAEKKQAEANARLAAANLENAEAGVAEAEALQTAAKAQAAASQAELERTESMVSRQAVQQKLLDEARQRSDAAAAEVEGAAAGVTMAQSRVAVAEASQGAAEAQVVAADAAIRVAKAERDELQAMLDYATLRAPFDGIVTNRGIDPGDLVRAGEESRKGGPLFVVTQTDKVRIRAALPEADAPLVDIGDAATVELAARGLPKVTGKVVRTSGSLDPNTRTLTVEIEAANRDGKLLPGMYGEATITLVEKPDAVTLPATAVRFDGVGKSYVYAIDDDLSVRLIDVEVGYDNGTTLEILANVPAGQRVIDAHLQRFQNGDKVRIVD